MKILELRFKNLNSLYGEWFINFRNPEYVSNGIFALTGPTGAGKSTILDALCLALYGSTPRLGKITKSSNEIMSRRTGECFAEVLFETRSGLYRCHWSQHRGRRKAEGDLQAPRHEIAEGKGEGKVIEHQLSRTIKAIQEKTGMDFDQFSRSILLAQGGFDTFLKADAEQKSRILEQITGTDIYTRISLRVHDQQREEHEKLKLLQAETAGIVLLNPDEEEHLRREAEELERGESAAVAEVSALREAIAWLKGMDSLKKEIVSLGEESENLSAQYESFKPEQEGLDLALKAAELEGEYAALTAMRKQQTMDLSALQSGKEALPSLEAGKKGTEAAFQGAEERTLSLREELKNSSPLFQKIYSMDQQLEEKKKILHREAEECLKEAALIKAGELQRSEILQKKGGVERELNVLEEYLTSHNADEALVTSLGGIEELLGQISSVYQDKILKKESLEKGRKKLIDTAENQEKQSSQVSRKKRELGDIRNLLEQVRRDSAGLLKGRLLREYRAEKEALLREMAYLSKIADLETERTKLMDGTPCPLCGSESHPFAQGNLPHSDGLEIKIEALTNLIGKAEEFETQIHKLEQDEKNALKNLSESEKLESEALMEHKALEAALSTLSEDLEMTANRLLELTETSKNRLKPFGIDEIAGDPSALMTSLRRRLDTWQEKYGRKGEIDKQISLLEGEVKSLDAVLESRKMSLEAKKTACRGIEEELEGAKTERFTLFGEKKPAVEEERLNRAIAEAEVQEKKLRDSRDEAAQLLYSARTSLEHLQKTIEARALELNKLESEFILSLQKTEFMDEKQFLHSRIPAYQRDLLKSKAKDLENRKTDLTARQKDRENRLNLEMEKKLTDSGLDILEPEFILLEEKIKAIRDDLAGLRHRLKENAAAEGRIREKQKSIEAQKKECSRWEKLHSLIGSGDGKKYRNFAQGLTFELMVSHANRQLGKMTDRYLLLRDLTEPLELNVMDNYQAGEIRSTKNLSGGESFIISLSLALGLSGMASRKVRVDSLFLDEGFGTLDEDALETALETLSSLHREGKLIGIISHVPALKERISTQISILPLSGGKSIVSGPGCRRGADF